MECGSDAEDWPGQPPQGQAERCPRHPDQEAADHVARPVRAHVDATQRSSHGHRGDTYPAPDKKEARQASSEENDSEHAQPHKERDMATRKAVAREMRRGMGKAGR